MTRRPRALTEGREPDGHGPRSPFGCAGHTCGTITVPPERLLPKATLVIHLSDDTLTTGVGVGRCEQLGPLTINQITQLLGHSRVEVRPVFNPNGIIRVDDYDIPAPMRRAVLQRHRYEIFPYGSPHHRQPRPRPHPALPVGRGLATRPNRPRQPRTPAPQTPPRQNPRRLAPGPTRTRHLHLDQPPRPPLPRHHRRTHQRLPTRPRHPTLGQPTRRTTPTRPTHKPRHADDGRRAAGRPPAEDRVATPDPAPALDRAQSATDGRTRNSCHTRPPTGSSPEPGLWHARRQDAAPLQASGWGAARCRAWWLSPRPAPPARGSVG